MPMFGAIPHYVVLARLIFFVSSSEVDYTTEKQAQVYLRKIVEGWPGNNTISNLTSPYPLSWVNAEPPTGATSPLSAAVYMYVLIYRNHARCIGDTWLLSAFKVILSILYSTLSMSTSVGSRKGTSLVDSMACPAMFDIQQRMLLMTTGMTGSKMYPIHFLGRDGRPWMWWSRSRVRMALR